MRGPHPGVKPISRRKEYTICVRIPYLNEEHSFTGDIETIHNRLLQSFPNMIMSRNELQRHLKSGMNVLTKDVAGNVIGGVK